MSVEEDAKKKLGKKYQDTVPPHLRKFSVLSKRK
jgi:hypothetical protein